MIRQLLAAALVFIPLSAYAQTGAFNLIGPDTDPNAPEISPLSLTNAINSQLRTKLDLGGDATMLLARVTGSTILRSLATRFSRVADPRDYGAYCNAVSHPLSSITSFNFSILPTNTTGWTLAKWQANGFPHATDLGEEMDAAALQEAAYAISAPTTGTVIIPSGCFINRTIHAVMAGTTFNGFGGGSIYTYPSHSFNLFSNDAPLVTYQDFAVNPGGGFVSAPSGSAEVFVIYDPFVATNPAATGQTANYKMIVRNVTMTNQWSGILSGGGDDVLQGLKMTFFTGPSGSSGVEFDAPYVDGRQLWDSGIYGATYGVKLLGSGSAVDLVNVELPGNGYCVFLQPPANAHIVSVTWDHVWCDSSATGGAQFDARAANSYISRIRIHDSWIGGGVGDGLDFYGTVRGTSITDSEFYGKVGSTLTGDAIHVDTSVGNALGFMVNSNKCAGWSNGSCVGIGANVSQFQIEDNALGPNADFGANKYPIFVTTGTSNDYIITGNRMNGNLNSFQNGSSTSPQVISPNIN